jgi:GDPmannose 4,6-dehydratase
MYLILQQDKPDDYVISTGITTSIRDFITMAFEEIGVGVTFTGEGVDEIGTIVAVDKEVFNKKLGEHYYESFRKRIGEVVVRVDPQYFRPTEVNLLIGDSTKARECLKWQPYYTLPLLISDMMDSDIKEMKKEAYLKEGGYKVLNYFE